MSNEPLATYWLAVLTTRFARLSDSQEWVYYVIARIDTPPRWILEMATVDSLEQILAVLQEQKYHEEMNAGYALSIGDAKLGYYYRMYREGRMSLHDFLAIAGDEADGGTSDLDPEPVFELLNIIEQRAANRYSDLEGVKIRVEEIFEPYGAIAEDQWTKLAAFASEQRGC